MLAKLSDFNLAKDVETCKVYNMKSDSGLVPVCWTAPEGILWGVFTPKSDVWSYGVLLWEIYSWAAVPYQRCVDETNQHQCPLTPYSNDDVINMLKRKKPKNLLDLPTPCSARFPEPIRPLMAACFDFDPQIRPSCDAILDRLNNYKQSLPKICPAPFFPVQRFQESGSCLSTTTVPFQPQLDHSLIELQRAYILPETNQTTLRTYKDDRLGCVPSSEKEPSTSGYRQLRVNSTYSNNPMPSLCLAEDNCQVTRF